MKLCRAGQQGDAGGRRQRSASPPATSTTSASANGRSAHLEEVGAPFGQICNGDLRVWAFAAIAPAVYMRVALLPYSA